MKEDTKPDGKPSPKKPESQSKVPPKIDPPLPTSEVDQRVTPNMRVPVKPLKNQEDN